MRLRHLLAALTVSLAWGGLAEASPKATPVDLDRVATAYAQYGYRYDYRGPRYRRVVYRDYRYRRPMRVVRYAPPYRYGYYRPRRVVRYVYPAYRPVYNPYRYGYYGRPYGYYRPARYYAGYGWPYYGYGYGRPYGGSSIGIGF
jgi:hypothetical protein